MNLTKTIHKTPVDADLVRQGWTEQEKQRITPKYDKDFSWVSEGTQALSHAPMNSPTPTNTMLFLQLCGGLGWWLSFPQPPRTRGYLQAPPCLL
jgi:hypothetical protein